MKPLITYRIIYVCILLSFISCTCNEKQNESNQQESEILFKTTMQKHLDAVSSKDLISLKSTMSPKGNMQLILPSEEIINSVDKFMEFHENWFELPNWTFETKILNTEIGEIYGIAIVEIVYREPERNGKPYFNRMTISYTLEKINNQWYIIKDHASSNEKSID